VSIEIQQPEFNPRFVLGLVENIEIRPSPYEVQRRLHLADMRPINNIVDATNYAMLEIGEPLHAFDHDILIERAGGNAPTIVTRTAKSGEKLTTLDGLEHQLDDYTVLVCDTAGPLSIAGVMGGAESEVHKGTRNVLLEGAAWNFTNIRRTISAQNMTSEAAYRFSRGVHPSLAEKGVRRGLELMRQWSNGTVSQGLVDNYPLPPVDPTVELTTQDIKRWLGITLEADEIAELLQSLGFAVQVHGEKIIAITPDHRLDIGEGIVGVADLLEEIARVYGYDRIPETRLADELPPQQGNRSLEIAERLKDILANLGLQEVIAHRLTTPEKEALRYPQQINDDQQSTSTDELKYIRIANPITSDRSAMRQSLLPGMLEIGERNSRKSNRLAFFEIGKVFLPAADQQLPSESRRIAILLSGRRALLHWQSTSDATMDFYDMKGTISDMLAKLPLQEVKFERTQHPTYHPGKCATVKIGSTQIGTFGEVHPLVKENYDLPSDAIMVAELDLEAILLLVPDRYNVEPVPVFPPVLEDLAVVVDEGIPAERIAEIIYDTGGATVTNINLFDVYRGGQAGPGKKSLAFNLTYQNPERTLTDEEVARIRQKIIKQLDKELGAQLRT
jgi:phenylalanyl-tRNA synthetase beta chain